MEIKVTIAAVLYDIGLPFCCLTMPLHHKITSKKNNLLDLLSRDLAADEKIKKYQSDLSNNQNNQRDRQQDIENQQKLLESLILKRKG